MTDGQPRVQRRRLADELRRHRRLPGLSGYQLAAKIGASQSAISRAENGRSVLSLPEVEAWANALGVSDDVRASWRSLTEAALNEVESWRARLPQDGLAAMQTDAYQLEASTHHQLCFQPAIIPSGLQTADYTRLMFHLVDVVGDNDYDAAVAARLQRQQLLYDTERTFEFLLTEAMLRSQFAPPEVMAAQIDRIQTAATLSNVTIEIIPIGAQIPVIAWVGFDVYEDRSDDLPPFVMIETPHAGMTISDLDDVEIYRQQFAQLRQAAAYDTADEILSTVGAWWRAKAATPNAATRRRQARPE